MSSLAKALTWPIVALLITGTLHFLAEAVRPDLKTAFNPTTLAPLLLAYGFWAGRAAVDRGGTFVHALAAGAVLGILPIALDIVGFGILLGRGTDAGTTAGAFGWLMIVFGALVGGGMAVSRVTVAGEEAAVQTTAATIPAPGV